MADLLPLDGTASESPPPVNPSGSSDTNDEADGDFSATSLYNTTLIITGSGNYSVTVTTGIGQATISLEYTLNGTTWLPVKTLASPVIDPGTSPDSDSFSGTYSAALGDAVDIDNLKVRARVQMSGGSVVNITGSAAITAWRVRHGVPPASYEL